ncbi:hypothetical protein [Roseovarius sp. TE539]|nr:hypothetical protein [Roseovarius sp. TE539]
MVKKIMEMVWAVAEAWHHTIAKKRFSGQLREFFVLPTHAINHRSRPFG